MVRRLGRIPRAASLVSILYVLTVCKLAGHASGETTVVYIQVLDSGGCPVRSPLDQLPSRRPAGIDGGRMPSIPATASASISPQLLVAQPLTEKRPPQIPPR